MPAEASNPDQNALVPVESADLPSQLESLLHVVWQCEAEWRVDDRIDLALRREEAAARAVRRPGRDCS